MVSIESPYATDFLLVINSNWHPIVPLWSYRSLLFKFWTLCIFEPPFRGLRGNVQCWSFL